MQTSHRTATETKYSRFPREEGLNNWKPNSSFVGLYNFVSFASYDMNAQDILGSGKLYNYENSKILGVAADDKRKKIKLNFLCC